MDNAVIRHLESANLRKAKAFRKSGAAETRNPRRRKEAKQFREMTSHWMVCLRQKPDQAAQGRTLQVKLPALPRTTRRFTPAPINVPTVAVQEKRERIVRGVTAPERKTVRTVTGRERNAVPAVAATGKTGTR